MTIDEIISKMKMMTVTRQQYSPYDIKLLMEQLQAAWDSVKNAPSKEWSVEQNGTTSTPVPLCRLVDSKERVLAEGFYVEYPEHAGYPVDYDWDSIPKRRGIFHYIQGDWGMPNKATITWIQPTDRIEILGNVSISPLH